jgi:hypothetical protein
MSPLVLAGVARGTWQIKKAVVPHSGRHRAARAPPVAGPLDNARIKQHPFTFRRSSTRE